MVVVVVELRSGEDVVGMKEEAPRGVLSSGVWGSWLAGSTLEEEEGFRVSWMGVTMLYMELAVLVFPGRPLLLHPMFFVLLIIFWRFAH